VIQGEKKSNEKEQKGMTMNTSQKGFANRLGIVAGLVLVGLLSAVAKSAMAGIETMADMNVFSWLIMASGLLLMFATPVAAIVALRYGKLHETEIRAHSGLSLALTVYRILFWTWAGSVLLAILFFGGMAVLFTHPVG